jgi:hypothetical protein
MQLMDFTVNPNAPNEDNVIWKNTYHLPHEWNWHCDDEDGDENEARIKHASGSRYSNTPLRMEALAKWLNR